MRSLLIYLSQAEWAKKLVMGFPLARRVALRFVAGETLEDAVAAVRGINETGMLATLDVLGEHSHTEAGTRQSAQRIIDAVEAIATQKLRASISLKLTQIGLMLDPNVCAQNLRNILEAASKKKIFVRIDMEDSQSLPLTLDIIDQMRTDGFENIGAVIQSYLYRSEEDVRVLLQKDITIRLVKGAYKEPPEIAFPQKSDVDASFDKLTQMMLDVSLKNAKSLEQVPDLWPPIAAVGSHDEVRIQKAVDYAQSIGLENRWLEFQMLYGIRRDLQDRLSQQGYPVRVYVPFGEDWYPYFMRRLAERPANLWFFASNLMRRN